MGNFLKKKIENPPFTITCELCNKETTSIAGCSSWGTGCRGGRFCTDCGFVSCYNCNSACCPGCLSKGYCFKCN